MPHRIQPLILHHALRRHISIKHFVHFNLVFCLFSCRQHMRKYVDCTRKWRLPPWSLTSSTECKELYSSSKGVGGEENMHFQIGWDKCKWCWSYKRFDIFTVTAFLSRIGGSTRSGCAVVLDNAVETSFSFHSGQKLSYKIKTPQPHPRPPPPSSSTAGLHLHCNLLLVVFKEAQIHKQQHACQACARPIAATCACKVDLKPCVGVLAPLRCTECTL